MKFMKFNANQQVCIGKKCTLITILHYILSFIALCAGMVVFSEGLSFARWDKWHSTEYFINTHAHLLAIAGAGIFCIALLFIAGFILEVHQMQKKINTLEERIDKLTKGI